MSTKDLGDLGVAAGDIFAKAFTLGYETGRKYIPAGGMALTAEQVEDVKIVLGQLERGGPAFEAAHERLRALFPATEPAEEETKAGEWTVRTVEERQALPKGSVIRSLTTGLVEERWGDGSWRVSGHTAVLDGSQQSAFPCEVLYPRSRPASSPVAEEETKAEPSTRQIADVIVEGRSQNMSWMQIAEMVKQVFFPASSPVVPAPTETGPWPSLLAVPVTVQKVKDAKGYEWHRRGSTDGWRGCNGADAYTSNCRTGHRDSAPFVAAEEG